MKTGPCLCGAPDCPSCGPDQGAAYCGKCMDCKADLYTVDDYWVDNMTDEVLCGDCRDRRIKTQPDLLEACEKIQLEMAARGYVGIEGRALLRAAVAEARGE